MSNGPQVGGAAMGVAATSMREVPVEISTAAQLLVRWLQPGEALQLWDLEQPAIQLPSGAPRQGRLRLLFAFRPTGILEHKVRSMAPAPGYGPAPSAPPTAREKGGMEPHR